MIGRRHEHEYIRTHIAISNVALPSGVVSCERLWTTVRLTWPSGTAPAAHGRRGLANPRGSWRGTTLRTVCRTTGRRDRDVETGPARRPVTSLECPQCPYGDGDDLGFRAPQLSSYMAPIPAGDMNTALSAPIVISQVTLMGTKHTITSGSLRRGHQDHTTCRTSEISEEETHFETCKKMIEKSST